MGALSQALSLFKRGVSSAFNQPVATPETDQHYFGNVGHMPNPDPVLRRMNVADDVYRAIAADPHVLGDIRSIRGSFRQLKWRILPGVEGDARAQAAADLCKQWMDTTKPNEMVDWLELMWQMASSILTGYRPHELIWDRVGGNILPTQIIDRPTRRILFDYHGKPLLVSRGEPMGVPIEPYQFVISRNMPSAENPYGIALLSSCFWAWTFKTGGWRYFVKYCERHGLPWPVVRYPLGTSDKDLTDLEQAVALMIENAYALVPDGTGVELLTPTTGASGTLPQENLITLCNKEMSKALTGQAMVSDNNGVGARAASETAKERQDAIDEGVRDIPAASVSQIFHWITLFNFGEGVASPKLEFFQQKAAGKDRAETYELAAKLGAKPSKQALLTELNIPAAQDAADELIYREGVSKTGSASILDTAKAKAGAGADGAFLGQFAGLRKFASAKPDIVGLKFAAELGLDDAAVAARAAQAANAWLDETVFQPAISMLARYEAEGKTLADFERDLGQLLDNPEADSLREITESAIKLAYLQGRTSVAQEVAAS